MRLHEAHKRTLIESRYITPMPILEDGEAPRWNFKYDKYKNDPNPDILLLGSYKNNNTNNNLVGGINLHYLSKDAIEDLTKVLPQIMQGNNLYQRYHIGLRLLPDVFDNYYRTYNANYVRGVKKDVLYPKYGYMKTASNWLKKKIGGIFKSKAEREQEAIPKYPEDLEQMQSRLDQAVAALQNTPPDEVLPDDEEEMEAARSEYDKLSQDKSMADVERDEDIPLRNASHDYLDKQQPAITPTARRSPNVPNRKTETITPDMSPQEVAEKSTPELSDIAAQNQRKPQPTVAQQPPQVQQPAIYDEPMDEIESPDITQVDDEEPEEPIEQMETPPDDELAESLVYYSPLQRRYIVEPAYNFCHSNYLQQSMHQRLNEGRNITLPPEVLSAIDQYLPKIMRQTCESKRTGKRFEMDLVQFNNKYIKKTYQKTIELNVIFHWDQMLKDPVMQEVKRQIDQLQNPNQIIKIVIDPKKSEEMLHTKGWANTNETQAAYSEKAGQNIDKIIDENRENIIGILDKYYSDEFDTYMRKLEAENNQEQIDKEIDSLCFRGIRYYFYEEIQRKQIVGIVNINEKYMCGKPTQMMRTLLVHEIIHCIDPKVIYNIRADKYYAPSGNYNYEDIKKYKSNEMEIEAKVGEMIQKIFDLVNDSTDYEYTKSQIKTIAQQLRGAPRPDLTKKSKNDNSLFVNWIKNFFDEFKSVVNDVKTGIVSDIMAPFVNAKAPNYISPLKSDRDFVMYTKELTPEIKRKVLERLSNAVLQAKEMLETKYKSK